MIYFNLFKSNFFASTASKKLAVLLFVFLSVFILSAIGLPTLTNAATVTPRIELSGDPGKTVTHQVKITNEERQSKTFYVSFSNFEAQDESGNPRFSERQEDLATWLKGPSSVTVGPGDSQEVTFAVVIPSNAEPGGHFAAIFFQTDPPNNPGQVALSAKLGSLVLLRVSGDFVQGADVLEFGTKNRKRFYTSLPIDFYYRFQNTGEDHLKPVGDVLISNTIGRTAKILPANPVDGSVLPKSIRRFEMTWSHGGRPLVEQNRTENIEVPQGFWKNVQYQWRNFAFGRYNAKLKVAFGTKELKSTNASYTFFVLPWQLLSVVITGLIIASIVGRFSLRRYNRRIIARARRESERESAVTKGKRKL